MADRIFRLDRREWLAGIGAIVAGSALPAVAAVRGRRTLTLRAQASLAALRPRQPETPVWSLRATSTAPALRFTWGDDLDIRFENELPVPTLLNWHGLGGVPAVEALTAHSPVAAGARENFVIPLRHAGTLLCDISLLGDGLVRPTRSLPVIAGESEPVAVDRGDEVFLVEDWRLRPDGTAIAPGTDPTGTTPVYTVNGQTALDIVARPHERLRFRFINGCQRAVIGLKIEGCEVRVMALDSQPSEPFPARNGAVVLAPGGRVDAFIDASTAGSTLPILLHDGHEARPVGRLIVTNGPPARDTALRMAPPLPSNGLPERLELRNALRFEIPLGGMPAGWMKPANFATASPAFRARTGRTVVLALTNSGSMPAVFHLHGHHFRLLDRLDDGWKPYWLDTLAVEAGQTERIAFAAQYAGHWLIETMATHWAAPRLVRWYSVE